MTDKELETREVTVNDPNLSDEANEILTDELRKALGAKQVQVPVGTPHREHDVAQTTPGLAHFFGRNRLLLGITFAAALVVGAILALATAQWSVLFIPIGFHAVATMVVGFMVVQMTTQVEAPDPAMTARLEDEGVKSPERAFNNLVEEFTGQADARGATEVVATGDNQGANERTAMSPTDSEPAGDYSMVMGMEWAIVIALAVASVVFAIVLSESYAWLLPAVMLPVCAGWAGYQVLAKRRADHRVDREAGDDARERRRMLLITAAAVLAVELVTVAVVLLGVHAGRS